MSASIQHPASLPDKAQGDITPIANGSNLFELLLFRLGQSQGSDVLFGINVLKVREIVALPEITPIVGSPPYSLGVVHLREQIIPVFDLPAIVGCTPSKEPSLMLITEYARSTQAFTVEAVEDIQRMDWENVTSAEATGTGHSLVTSITKIQDESGATRLVLVLDVEAVLEKIRPAKNTHQSAYHPGGIDLAIHPGAIILAADDSAVARKLIESMLNELKIPFEMTKTGKEAWDRLGALSQTARSEGLPIEDKVALVLTDLEMPEMDGFTLTHRIKEDDYLKDLPVVIHSSLSGSVNEERVRAAGANGYVAKFAPDELAQALHSALATKKYRTSSEQQ